MLKGVSIFPVFNPDSVGYWDDFMRIYTNASRHNYNWHIDYAEHKQTLASIQKILSKSGFKFAFGAYYDNKIIGCAIGMKENGFAHLQHLYIEPEYQHNGVGRQLLQAAEATSSLFSNKLTLISLARAENFYTSFGYKVYTLVNGYEKDIRNAGHCKVLPVFSCTYNLAQKLSKISGIDYKTIMNSGPIFVYQDADNKICAYGTTKDKSVHSQSGNQWAHNQVSKKIIAYNQFLSNQK